MNKLLSFFFLAISFHASAQYSVEEVYSYMDRYKGLAVELMEKEGIPASIILAQAIYATDAGTDELAVKGNNHFGTLCQQNYEGDIYYKMSGENPIAYVQYGSPRECYEAHAGLLKGRSKYSSLFRLESTDYRGWAKGLQEKGFSLNPTYGNQLIDIIEKYKLHSYDRKIILTGDKQNISGYASAYPEMVPDEEGIVREIYVESGIEIIVERKIRPSEKECSKDSAIIIENVAVNPVYTVFTARDFEYMPSYYPNTTRKVYLNNKTRFIIAGQGDTYRSLASDLGIQEKDLRLYNDIFDQGMEPAPGEVIYLHKKKKKSEVAYHTVQEGESMRYIAQKYAVPLETVFIRNHSSIEEFKVGNTICISCRRR